MSLPELIPSNLPQFVQNKNRSVFENSVIPAGSVLLFAESDGQGGSKLIAKNPDGSFSEIGGGGGGGGTSFYKCASVDTVNSEWTGYLASVDSTTGVWSFASTATSGLTFDRITPVIGIVYDEACTFMVMDYKAGIPDDCLMYYPLFDSLNDQKGNTSSEISGLYSFDVYNGIPSCYLKSTCTINGTNFAGSSFTITMWINPLYAAGNGGESVYLAFPYPKLWWRQSGEFRAEANGFGSWINVNPLNGSWFFVKIFASNGSCEVYVNDVLLRSSSGFGLTSSTQVCGTNTYWCEGYYSSLRLYNRILNSNELSALANEFTPTVS